MSILRNRQPNEPAALSNARALRRRTPAPAAEPGQHAADLDALRRTPDTRTGHHRVRTRLPWTGWSSWTRWLTILAIGMSFVACVAIALDPRHRSAPGDAWLVMASVASAIVAFFNAGAEWQGKARPAWRLVGLGLVCQSLAALAWGLMPFVTVPDVFAAWTMICHVVAAPLAVAGLLAFRSSFRRPVERLKFALDVGAILFLGAMLSWYLMRLSNPTGDVVHWLRTSPGLLLLPGLELLGVVSVAAVWNRLGGRGDRRGVALMGLGLVLAFASTAVESWHITAGTAVPTAIECIGRALLLLGLLMEYNTRPVEAAPQSAAGADTAIRSTLVPYTSVVLGAAMLADLSLRAGNHEITAFIGAMFLMTLMVIARQAVSVRENARRSNARAHAESETRFRSLVQHSTDLITIIDGADTIRYVSPAINRVFGYEIADMEGKPLRDLVHTDDVVPMLGFLADAAKPGSKAATTHWRMLSASGAWCRVENVAVNLLADPTVGGVVLTTRDVSHRVALEEQLVHRAFHDELTGLANRALFTNRVEQALLRASRDGRRTAVLFLDLDDFKEINDSLGHAAGDSLLMQGADRLRACLRAGDTAARLGGDEFAVLLEGCNEDGEEAMHVAERISMAFARPFSLENREAFSTASIGVAINSGTEAGEDLLRNADLAMYLAKRRGKARVERFASHMHEEVVERLDLLADLRYAIERDELQLEYQPIVDLETRTVTGLETLVRWDHPRRGRIPPADFIPIAEQSGLIVAIGRWVMLHACAHARHWSRSLPELLPVTVTVNLSARQLGDEHLIDDVANALRVAGLRRDQLVLELTESTLLANSEETVGILTSLKALGVRLAIDDFGTGYSSLSYLHRFPVDVLKIDRSFVEGVADGPGASALANAVIALGNSLGLRTVAEGIESEAQHAVLAKLGCKFGQGYLFSPPLPPADVMPYLARHGQRGNGRNTPERLTPLSTRVIS
ncbi:MAG: EAL domain-containing protein [Gemmatimonadaceae bacterium]|nr:EAL domain-containing protein [Gemmatimonadaceae bacterium]